MPEPVLKLLGTVVSGCVESFVQGHIGGSVDSSTSRGEVSMPIQSMLEERVLDGVVSSISSKQQIRSEISDANRKRG